MTRTIHHIRGDRQTGKTTMALGFLERLHTAGHPVLYVAPTVYMARDRQRYTPVPCVGLQDMARFWLRHAPGRPSDETTAVVFDDCDFLPRGSDAPLLWAWERLSRVDGPTQMVLVNWRGEFPPKVPQCSTCGTTANLRRDLGSGGPWRCTSPDCVVF